MDLTATELRDKDPKQFEKEYQSWVQGFDWEWWDCIEEDFKEKCKPIGINVDRIYFTGFYCQGDHAGFEGSVDLWTFMKHMKLDEEYPALYAAIVDDGSYIKGGYGNYRMEFELRKGTYDTLPSGVFKDLDEDTWYALVSDQWDECGLESAVKEVCNDLCYDLWRELEKEYEYLTNEDSFIESCECNDVTFEYQGEEDESGD